MEIVSMIIGFIPVVFFLLIVIGTPVLIIIGSKKQKKYTNAQIASGEDKRILLNFAGSIFKQPENYTYAVGNYTKTVKTGYRTYTSYYYSYLLAFNQAELHVISFKASNHEPVYRNIMTFDFAEMQLTHRRAKNSIEMDLYYAGEKQHITVPDIVKASGSDDTDTPFAVEQSREVQLLEQMLMQFEARSYQIQTNGMRQ